MIKETIAALVEGRGLSRDEAQGTMREIMAGEATPAQIAAYITALRIRGETPEVIAGSAEAMRQVFTPVHAKARVVVDTCGTGGDGAHTFNISTGAALVAAAAGATVAKHGNRSVSSKCGSADVFAALGVKVDIAAEAMSRCLDEVGIAFLFAPALHPAMKHAIGPRREVGIRSIFNILGPLSNPAGARYGVLGVYSRETAAVLARAAAGLGAQRLFVVHGNDGLDEITTTGPTYVAEVANGCIREYELNPGDAGLPVARSGDLSGGDSAENAAILRRILEGEKGPRRDIVLLNASAALVAADLAGDFKEGVALAARALDSGAARDKLAALVAQSQA